jgi:hypothetical protein
MSPAGNWSRKVREVSQNRFGITYIFGFVALKCAVVDLHIASAGINSAALEVPCGPPGIGAKN